MALQCVLRTHCNAMRNKSNPIILNENLLSQVAEVLASHGTPAISAYDLAIYAFLRINTFAVDSTSFKVEFAELCKSLLKIRLLTAIDPVADTKGYLLFGKASSTPAEIMCSLDPFAYVSHLGAMEYHGLTDRFPQILYMTRPSLVQWKQQAKVRMAKDLGERLQIYLASGLPKLVQPKIVRLGQTSIQFCERSQQGAFRLVAGSSLRVATIGRVFLEMIREPTFCGGLQHVIDVYQREAKRYLKLIVDEINQHGLPIDKVRAGYLLSEVCRLESPALSEWQQFAQRGGSRKLDSEGEYVPIFSERWQLSINLPSLTGVANDE